MTRNREVTVACPFEVADGTCEAGVVLYVSPFVSGGRDSPPEYPQIEEVTATCPHISWLDSPKGYEALYRLLEDVNDERDDDRGRDDE